MLDLPWASPERGRERTRQPPWLHRALLPEPNPTPTAASQMLRAGQKHLGCTRTLSAPAPGRCCRWRGLTDAQPPQGCLGSPTLAAWLCHPSLSLGDRDAGGKWDHITPAVDLWDGQTPGCRAATASGSKQQIPPWKWDFFVQAGPGYC